MTLAQRRIPTTHILAWSHFRRAHQARSATIILQTKNATVVPTLLGTTIINVFAIGTTGQVGLAIVRRMTLAGHEVTGFARSETGAARLSQWGIGSFIGNLETGLQATVDRAREADIIVFSPNFYGRKSSR